MNKNQSYDEYKGKLEGFSYRRGVAKRKSLCRSLPTNDRHRYRRIEGIRRMWRGPVVALLLLVSCGSLEARARDVDVVSVESLRREVRAPAPSSAATEVQDLLSEESQKDSKKSEKTESGKSDGGGYYKTFGSDAEGEKGYLKATFSKGNHGYKSLDTFHKQDGDKYAFEKHLAYGKSRGDKKSGHHDEAASSRSGDHESAGTMVDSHYIAVDGDHQDGGDEQAEASDHESYTHEDGGHYTGHGPESSSYEHSESHSDGDGENGSYNSHSSYSESSAGSSGGGHGSGGGHYY
ncbi:uncharacterized protein LOC143433489 [Xylocopa sonorina]|uniref:uncharacterized protein LOC143433489 n=1 Tax=Xylocopa sonorina TaxID=1818115 RepID=UPI00403ADAAB